VFIATQTTQIIIIDIKAISLSHCSGNIKYAISATQNKLTIFQIIKLTAENSIFIFACIKDKIEEFRSCKIVKIEAIIMEIRAIFEL
jgi:hypothetical protein